MMKWLFDEGSYCRLQKIKDQSLSPPSGEMAKVLNIMSSHLEESTDDCFSSMNEAVLMI